ncbi:hypothetical protein PALB_1290 [Pseudoalteromonas luteoviolacea B = ATCC 29581]|nr:hypothetical protein PALB_1290 [Pseudoalteromonas luteoviolacea B = ATCC 29581]
MLLIENDLSCHGVSGVAGSNPAMPTILSPLFFAKKYEGLCFLGA